MRKFRAVPGKGIFAAEDNSANNDYIYVPNLWARLGPDIDMVDVPISFLINDFDSSQIRGSSTNAKYMTVLLRSSISGTVFKELIFSNNLNECRNKANKWLDSISHWKPTIPWNDYSFWALIYDLESDTVVLYEDIDSYGHSLLKEWGYNNADSDKQGDVEAATNIAAAEDAKRDIMELPTSERCDLINQLKNETSASFISINAVKDYFEKFGYDASDYSLDQFNSDWEDAKTITKRDIMELPTSERLRVISDMLDKYPSGISTEAAMKYLEDHGWDTSNYPTEQFDSDWDDYLSFYDEDDYDDEDDDNIDWIETRADARRWLNEKQKEYGSTYFFPDEERYKLDKLIEKFGSTYFWDREALED